MKATMTQFAMHPMRRLAWAWVAATLLALAPAAVAQHRAAAQNAQAGSAAQQATVPAAKPAAKPVAEEETAAPNTPGNQGIKVHGHWVLQVKNADGTLGERREFDNSLSTIGVAISGDQILGALLSGNASPSDPSIALIDSSAPVTDPTAVCDVRVSSSPLNCVEIVTPTGNNITVFPASTNLTATIYFSPTVRWVLSGSYTVPDTTPPAPNTFYGVETLLALCATEGSSFIPSGLGSSLVGSSTSRTANLAPKFCSMGATFPATGTDILGAVLTYSAIPSGPLQLTVGQIVQVTVTISFS
jgi:hypothetical protein